MPHVTIFMYPGHTKEEKCRVSGKIQDIIAKELHTSKGGVSVSMQEIAAENWKQEVYDKQILNETAELVIKPGYKMP